MDSRFRGSDGVAMILIIETATAANALPVEFVLTGIRPEPWTISSLVLRQNSFGDESTSRL